MISSYTLIMQKPNYEQRANVSVKKNWLYAQRNSSKKIVESGTPNPPNPQETNHPAPPFDTRPHPYLRPPESTSHIISVYVLVQATHLM